MYVAQHKTSKVGPAPLSMNRSLHSMVVLYVKHVRPSFAKKKVKELFVNRSGREFDGTIGKRVAAWWRKARGKKLRSTALRKMTASTLHDADSVDKRKVHKHMCHKESTADKSYLTAARTRVALERHQILRCNLGLDNEAEEEVKEQQDQKKEEREEQGQEKEEEQESEEQEGEGPEEDVPEQDNTCLSREQLDHIDLLFADEIVKNAKINFKDVGNGISTCQCLPINRQW